MDDVWFAAGLTRADFDGFLQAMSLPAKQHGPLLAVADDTEGAPALILASRALFGLFGVDSVAALSDRLLRARDPGASRLATLYRTLPLEGAPRLERLRFNLGPSSEIITFLCRRVPGASGRPAFVAAALGLRAGLIPADLPEIPPSAKEPVETPAEPPQAAAPRATKEPGEAPVTAAAPMNVQAIQATLRARWPSSRTIRFLWQTDADMVCTQISPPLADIVGAANADLVGSDLGVLAPRIDPTGRLAVALKECRTWSGLDVEWPIADTPAAVAVGLGAMPTFDPERAFAGYRGYGIVHLDRIVTREPTRLTGADPAADRPPNVVPFPGQRSLSAEDQKTFDALRAELRDQAGIPDVPSPPVPEEPVAIESPPAPLAALPVVDVPAETKPEPALRPALSRDDEIARNGLAVLDRLALGLLVSRDNVPIFANRHLLDLLGFPDEDALHAAGGLAHLFGGMPGNVSGAEAVGVRARDGSIIPANARVQRIDWDGLPATLLTLTPQTPPPQEPKGTGESPPLDAGRADDAARDDGRSDDAPGPLAAAPPDEQVRAAEHELRELRAILETATDGVAVIDSRCNILSLNRSGEALFGCDRGAVIGKPFVSLFAPHNQNLAADYFEGLKSSATKSLLNDGREFEVKAPGGATIPVFMTLGRLGPGKLAGETATGTRFCALFRDLTHWKKVERDLEEARRSAERSSALKTDFLAKVSHEVRTPLNAIIGFAEVIMDERFGPVGNARYKDYLRDIHTSGTHVMSLVNDLLDLSKIEAGKMELAAEALDLNKVVGEGVALMQPQASRERVIMRLSLAPLLPQVKADARSLRQIVLNLLSNAVKFNEPGGQVIVATALTEGGHVVIRIRDTGAGMSETDIAAALEPFRQLSNAGKPMAGGTGLGLPLTKALVEANEAAFTIRSKVDQGTLVEVAFPPARVLAGGHTSR